MSSRSSTTRYGNVAIAIHWSSALGVILALAAGLALANGRSHRRYRCWWRISCWG